MLEPNVPLLLECARRLARSVGVAPASDKDVRRVIDDTLYGRQILAAGRQGLITREETGYVLVGHWLSDLFMKGTFKGDDPVFVREVAAAILGPAPKGSPAKNAAKKKPAKQAAKKKQAKTTPKRKPRAQRRKK